jgi:hypothetical protein
LLAQETSVFRSHVWFAQLDSNEESTGDSLEDVGTAEREYVRERLREELNREPSDEEIDKWLREQTEGY